MSNSTSRGTALITGASRGIGAVYADRLAKRGYDLILVARSEAPLKALTASLAGASGRHITPIVADLNNKLDLAKVEAKLKEDSSVTMLVNNAGIGAVVPLLNADIEKMEEMIALNSIALTRLTYAAAPAFVKRGTGALSLSGSAQGGSSADVCCFKTIFLANARSRLRLGGWQNFGDAEGHLDPARAIVNIRSHVAIQAEPDCSAAKLNSAAKAHGALLGIGYERTLHDE